MFSCRDDDHLTEQPAERDQIVVIDIDLGIDDDRVLREGGEARVRGVAIDKIVTGYAADLEPDVRCYLGAGHLHALPPKGSVAAASRQSVKTTALAGRRREQEFCIAG